METLVWTKPQIIFDVISSLSRENNAERTRLDQATSKVTDIMALEDDADYKSRVPLPIILVTTTSCLTVVAWENQDRLCIAHRYRGS